MWRMLAWFALGNACDVPSKVIAVNLVQGEMRELVAKTLRDAGANLRESSFEEIDDAKDLRVRMQENSDNVVLWIANAGELSDLDASFRKELGANTRVMCAHLAPAPDNQDFCDDAVVTTEADFRAKALTMFVPPLCTPTEGGGMHAGTTVGIIAIFVGFLLICLLACIMECRRAHSYMTDEDLDALIEVWEAAEEPAATKKVPRWKAEEPVTKPIPRWKAEQPATKQKRVPPTHEVVTPKPGTGHVEHRRKRARAREVKMTRTPHAVSKEFRPAHEYQASQRPR